MCRGLERTTADRAAATARSAALSRFRAVRLRGIWGDASFPRAGSLCRAETKACACMSLLRVLGVLDAPVSCFRLREIGMTRELPPRNGNLRAGGTNGLAGCGGIAAGFNGQRKRDLKVVSILVQNTICWAAGFLRQDAAFPGIIPAHSGKCRDRPASGRHISRSCAAITAEWR